jgi:hypothetical protein
VHERQTGSFRRIAFLFSLLVIIYALLGVLLHFHIRWWTQPFRYPGFSKNAGFGETFALTGVGTWLAIPGIAVILFLLWKGVSEFLVVALNLDSRETKPGGKAATKFFGRILLGLICVGILILPIVG